MTRKNNALRQTRVIDWNGTIIRKRLLSMLIPGCVVRVIVQGVKSTECLYFTIIKIKDGTFWGVCKNTYRFQEHDIKTGQIFTFRKNQITEIPIDWQPKRFRKYVNEKDICDHGVGVTGLGIFVN